MKRYLALVALISSFAGAQGVPYNSNAWTAATNVPVGAQAPIYTVPKALVSICTDSTCGTPVNIYNNQALSGSPLQQPIPADNQGRYSFFVAAGTYWEKVCSPGGSCGGDFFSVGGSGGSSFALNGITGSATLAVTSPLTLSSSGSTLTISQASAFTITSFTGGSTVELGASVANPAFAATYSAVPASAQITNTDGLDSPHALSTPFTSATISGTFTHTSSATTTFTLSATQGTTQTATQTISWLPAIFGGVGTAGATSSVTASGTNALLSTGDSIARTQLGPETVGQQWSFSPSGQVIYLLLTGSSHTFVDANTGFPFAMNAPLTVTFVNAHGVTVTMYLYQSTNPLFGSYAPRVAS